MFVGAIAVNRLITDLFKGTVHEPFTNLTFAAGMIGLGGFYLWYIEKGYRGGAPSIIGAFLLVVGAFALASIVDEPQTQAPYRLFISISAALILLAFGAVLLRSGHKYHVSRRPGTAQELT